jgi:hypothetical protein
MNVAYELNQTSGYDWNRRIGARVYHRQKPAPTQSPRLQVSEFAELETQMECYENEHHKLIDKIRSLYVMQDDASVSEFLRRHRQLPQVLADAEPHLRQFFKDSVLSLRTTSDEDGWEMLYAFVQWAGEPGDALRALDAFDDTWWLANSYPVGSNLTFTYRLI